MIALPRKDDNGEQYVSYSQIKLFKRNVDEWVDRYVFGAAFTDNPYAAFGRAVGTALETGDFRAFPKAEAAKLSEVTRLLDFEVETRLDMGDYYVKGFIDTTDYSIILDYKTGGVGKHKQYEKDDYYQTELYAMSMMQQEGIVIDYTGVEFITRAGNYWKGLNVDPNAPIISIEKRLSPERERFILDDIKTTVSDMSDLYKKLTDC